jgi:hypothetical protein
LPLPALSFSGSSSLLLFTPLPVDLGGGGSSLRTLFLLFLLSLLLRALAVQSFLFFPFGLETFLLLALGSVVILWLSNDRCSSGTLRLM